MNFHKKYIFYRKENSIKTISFKKCNRLTVAIFSEGFIDNIIKKKRLGIFF